MVKNIVISGTNFWNPGDDFVRDGVINILKNLFKGYTLNFMFYNFNPDYTPPSKLKGLGNTIAKGDIERYRDFIDAVVVVGLSAGWEIKDLYNWVIENHLLDRVYLIGEGYESEYAEIHVNKDPEATIFKNARVIIGRTKKKPKFISDLNLPYYHLNCPSVLSVESVKDISPNKKIERIAFSIQLPPELGISNQSCDKSMYELILSILFELSQNFRVEIIAHHKSEYFHFLNLLKKSSIPVIFSSFYQDLYKFYPRYDLVITTRLHSSLFANGYGIPGIIINDTDRHTHCLEGFPHSIWVNNREKFYQAFDSISKLGLHNIAKAAEKFKYSLMQRYISILSASFVMTEDKSNHRVQIRESHADIVKDNKKFSGNDKKLVQELLPLLIRKISSVEVKQRVYSILINLERDFWLEQDIKRYKEAIDLKQSWFDLLTFLNFYAYTFRPTNYLEIGVRRGRSMAQVLSASPHTRGYGIDLWVADYATVPEKGIFTANPGPDFVQMELKKIGINSLPILIQGNSHTILPEFFADSRNPQYFDLILVDGDHSYDGAKSDLDIAFSHLSPGGALVFDDIAHPAHLYLKNLWTEYMYLFGDHLFIEDLSGNGVGVAFKPPFDKFFSLFTDTSYVK